VEAIRCNLCSLKPCWRTAYNFLRYGTASRFVRYDNSFKLL